MRIHRYMKKTVVRILGGATVAALAVAATSMSQGPRLALSIVVGLPSFVLLIISRRQLGTSFSVNPEARTLVTKGLYSKIQHPMYLFLDLFIVALIVALDWSILLPIWGILVVVQVLRARREEKVLASAFGVEYRTYEARTWL
jgi:protein-S-isoprenylcysteine O-methyltransferase Ste14